MRGSGSTYNDIVDRDLDARVERTRQRPVASGRVSVGAAKRFLVAQGAPRFSRRHPVQSFHDPRRHRLAGDRGDLSFHEAFHLMAAGRAGPGLRLGRSRGMVGPIRRACSDGAARLRGGGCLDDRLPTRFTPYRMRATIPPPAYNRPPGFSGRRIKPAVGVFYVASVALLEAACAGRGRRGAGRSPRSASWPSGSILPGRSRGLTPRTRQPLFCCFGPNRDSGLNPWPRDLPLPPCRERLEQVTLANYAFTRPNRFARPALAGTRLHRRGRLSDGFGAALLTQADVLRELRAGSPNRPARPSGNRRAGPILTILVGRQVVRGSDMALEGAELLASSRQIM